MRRSQNPIFITQDMLDTAINKTSNSIKSVATYFKITRFELQRNVVANELIFSPERYSKKIVITQQLLDEAIALVGNILKDLTIHFNMSYSEFYKSVKQNDLKFTPGHKEHCHYKPTFITQTMLDECVVVVGPILKDIVKYFNIGSTEFYRNVKRNNLTYVVNRKSRRSTFTKDVTQAELNFIMREHGATLEQLGTYFGISRERVRQLCKKRNLTRPKCYKAKKYGDHGVDVIYRKNTKEHPNYISQMHKYIMQICHDPNFKQYQNVGAKGIEVSEEFYNNFPNFVDYMRDELHYFELKEKDPTICLVRIDVDKNYERGNLALMSSAEVRNRPRSSYVKKRKTKLEMEKDNVDQSK